MVTDSDTEVVLRMYMKYGQECLSYFNGMFAFVIYDKIKNEFFIARDRLGIKPLYYRKLKDSFIFAVKLSLFYTCSLMISMNLVLDNIKNCV